MKLHQLTSVLDFQGGSQPPKKEFENEPSKTNVRFLQIRDFKRDDKIAYIPVSKKNRLCKKEDILIARYGASVGQILTGKEGAYNVALMKVIDSNKLFNVKYLNYFFNSPYFQNSLLSRSERSAQAGFNKKDLSEIKIPVPPLQEQEKIVEKLDKLFQNFESFYLSTNSHEEKIKYLQTAFLAKLFNVDETFYELDEIGALCEFQSGLWTGKKAPFKTVKVLRNTNFTKVNTLKLEDIAEIQVEEKMLEKRKLEIGNILIEKSGGGPNQPVGRVVYIDDRAEGYSFSNFTSRITTKNKKLKPKYLYWFLNYVYRSGKTELMQKRSTGIRNLQLEEYKKLTIPIPPLDDQEEIIKRCENVYILITKILVSDKTKNHLIDNLKKSILNKEFSYE